MKRKRIVCVALSLMLVLSLAGFTGCGKKSASNGELNILHGQNTFRNQLSKILKRNTESRLTGRLSQAMRICLQR